MASSLLLGVVQGRTGIRAELGRALGASVLASSLLASCAGSQAAPNAAAADDALLRDEVLDEVMQEEKAKQDARRAEAASRAAKTTSSGSERGSRSVGVRGITGSLNAFDVEQAMNRRAPQLLACVEQRPRSLGHVAGEIAFHFDVDARGKVERALITQSDLGYTPLEDCLLAVVTSAPFPAPAGAQRAEAQWRMSVDPLRAPAEPIDPTTLEETIERQSEASYEECTIAKGRQFLVNGYLGATGKLQAVSVRAPWLGAARAVDEAPEQLSCLAEALGQWTHWPKANGNAKVSFELRWVAAPPVRHARAKRAKR